MSANNSKSRKVQRRAVALKNFSVNQERLADTKYRERKEQERLVLVNGSVAQR